ncbi:MAG: DUF3861 domain-containing protein [Ferrovibrio sp.]
MGPIPVSDSAWKGHAMRGHSYRVTIEHTGTPRDGMALQAPLVFAAVNHDEIIGIVERIRASGHYSEDEAAALGIGLKLFSEVMLKRKDDPLFKALRPAIGSFIGGLKDRNRTGPAPEAGAGAPA